MPHEARSFKLSNKFLLKKLSSDILHPKDKPGNHPQRLPFAKLAEPSQRKVNSAKYLPA